MSHDDGWLAFAEQQRALGAELCKAMAARAGTNQELVLALLYAREFQSFQAALLLARAGLMGDARATVRSGVESAVAIVATARDPSFVERLVEADTYRRVAWARTTLGDPSLHADLSAEQLQNLRDLIDQAALSEHKARPINWEQVAANNETKALYHTHYRNMSWHLHVGIESLNTFAVTTPDQKIVGIRWEADTAGFAQTVSAACDALFWASAAVSEFFSLTDLAQQVKAQHRAFAGMLELDPVPPTP